MSDVKKYPIAEIFTSIQGEGHWSGTVMTFIRLAGCSVGRKIKVEELKQMSAIKQANFVEKQGSVLTVLQPYTEMCTLYDGREFLCDTDFQTKEVLTAKEIVKRIPEGVEHVCLTGGEPLMHDVDFLIQTIEEREEIDIVHIETSGTIDYEFDCLVELWFTVAPKKGVTKDWLESADEIKILVDEKFDFEKFDKWCEENSTPCKRIFFQPVNNEHTLNFENVERVKKLVMEHPRFKISTQLHKVWSVR